MVTLANPVPSSYSKTIRPVCLASGSDQYTGRKGTVVGWGSLYENGPQPNELMELTMEGGRRSHLSVTDSLEAQFQFFCANHPSPKKSTVDFERLCALGGSTLL